MNKNNYHHETSEDNLLKDMLNTKCSTTKAVLRDCIKARHENDNQTPTPVDYDETKKHWWS